MGPGSPFNNDPVLVALLDERYRLLPQLAVVLRRAGPTHPKRAAVNAKHARQRKSLRRALRRNADALAARLALIDPRARAAVVAASLTRPTHA